jgi:hypothetical protein
MFALFLTWDWGVRDRNVVRQAREGLRDIARETAVEVLPVVAIHTTTKRMEQRGSAHKQARGALERNIARGHRKLAGRENLFLVFRADGRQREASRSRRLINIQLYSGVHRLW